MDQGIPSSPPADGVGLPRTRELTPLERVSVDVVAASSVDEILERVAHGAREVVGAAVGMAGYAHAEGTFCTRVARVSGTTTHPEAEEPLTRMMRDIHLDLDAQDMSIHLGSEALACRRERSGLRDDHTPQRDLMVARLAGTDGRPTGLIAVGDRRGVGSLEEEEAALKQLATLTSLALRHIAARTEAQARAAEAEEGKRILDALMTYIPEGITIAEGPEVTIRMISRYGQQMIGRDATEVEDIPAREQGPRWNLLSADGSAADVKQLPLARAARRGELVTNEELVLERPDGTMVPVSCNSGPVLDRNGRIVGAVMAWRDITERKRAEQALLEADRRKDAFLALLAHELRNPLAPLISATKILERSPDDEEIRAEALQVIDRQVWHMVRLIDDLLDVSRITRGAIRLQREPIDLMLIIESAVTANRPLIDERSHRFELRPPSEPVVVHADPTRLTQVLSNLLNNAAKYTPAGGNIWLAAARQGDDVEIRVGDDGQGIAPEELPRLFDMFTQGGGAHRRARQGLGVGLALAKELTAMHGGTIAVQSPGPGKGAEFIVRIPALPPEAVAPSSPSGADADVAAEEQLKVLVVDDSADAARSLATLLELMGYAVALAYDGPAALRAVDTEQPRAVILDLGMPEMDGLEVARRLRERFAHEELLLVALTGWGKEEDRQRTAEAGFDHHLTKPARPATLRRLLDDFVRRGRAQPVA